MDNIDIDGTPFSVLLDRAVKIKSSQSAQLSQNYHALPSFIQASIFPSVEVINARNLDSFTERFNAAMAWKEDGNAAYRDGHFEDALANYKMALSIFRYVENTNPNVKNEGIKDEYIREIVYVPQSTDEEQLLRHFLVNIYNNLALVSLKREDHRSAIEACDCAIEVDGRNDKAFYLRAQARLVPKSSSALDEEQAMMDLKAAAAINPNNKQARSQLKELRLRVKSQRLKDKRTFAGLFNRGEVYDTKEPDQEGEPRTKRHEKSKDQEVILARQLAQLYDERGMIEERTQIEDILKSMNDASAREQGMKEVDFRNPTAKMVEEANSFGIDLTCPQTIELLEHMQQEKSSYDRNSKQQNTNAVAIPKKYSSTRLLKILRGAAMLCVLLIVYIRLVNIFLLKQIQAL